MTENKDGKRARPLNGLSRILLCGVVRLASGCTLPREEAALTNRHAAGKIPALKRIGRAHHPVPKKELADVIDQLESPDSAVRLYAVNALRELTGSDGGYHYFDSPEERAKAVAAWRAWLVQQPDEITPLGAHK